MLGCDRFAIGASWPNVDKSALGCVRERESMQRNQCITEFKTVRGGGRGDGKRPCIRGEVKATSPL